MANINRPLSPHLQVYRWQLTSVLSITHRATGVVLSAGVPFLLYWIWSLTAGADAYANAQWFFGSIIGRLLLLGFSFSLFYHLCNGVRHLFWDIGKGLEIRHVYRSGWIVVVAAVALTLVAWLAAYAVRGAGA
ncbi:MAG: succinate dehydrogenase, cytochrome b556 subunit [Arenicellales bacterium]